MRISKHLATFAFVSYTLAQNVQNCVSGGVCYAVNVPEVTASSGSGDVYIQITGPTSMSWIGLGQGVSMTGANIFMIYANEAGNNVTVSPRLGVGEREPTTNGAASQVTLLAGSGIENSMMTANFRCSNCNSWSGGSMNFRDTGSNWIWAYRRGSAISSSNLAVRLTQHDSYGDMILNLQAAAGGSSPNPFVTSSGSGTSTSTTGSTANSTSNGSSGSVSASNPSPDPKHILLAHAVLLTVAFALFYPLGAMAIRLLSFRGLVWVHAGWMAFTYLVVLAGMGLGVWYAVENDYMKSNHAIIGLVVVGCLLLQPITGLIHHRAFKSKGGATAITSVHVWGGRAVVTLGIINGGLGLQLTGSSKKGAIAYGAVAGVIWVSWMAVALFTKRKQLRDSGNISRGSNEKMNHSTSPQSGRELYSGQEVAQPTRSAGRIV